MMRSSFRRLRLQAASSRPRQSSCRKLRPSSLRDLHIGPTFSVNSLLHDNDPHFNQNVLVGRGGGGRHFSTKPIEQMKVKPWLNPHVPVDERVNEFLQSPTVHRADLHATDMKLLLQDCCKKGNLEGMEQAHSVLERLYVEKRNFQNIDPESTYTVDQSFVSTVLFGWVRLATSLRVAQVRMRELLDTAIDEAKYDAKTNPTIDKYGIITVQAFNTYLQGLANAAVKNPQAAIAAEATLYEMDELHRSLSWQTKPNARSYGLVIHAFACTRHRNAGERALGIFRRLKQQYQLEVKEYAEKFGTPYVPPTDFTPDLKENKHEIAAPDVAIYTSCMKALLDHQPDRAIDLLQEAIDDNIPLDGGVFILPMNGMARKMEKEGNAKRRIVLAENTEKLLEQMILLFQAGKLKHNPKDERIGHKDTMLQIGFNACIDVWSRAFVREAALRCEALLHTMIDGSVDATPTSASFNSCLYAWYKGHKFHSDTLERSKALLDLQWEVAKEIPEATPDFQSYAIAINTIAKSDHEDKLGLATDLLAQLLQRVESNIMDCSRNPSAPFAAILGVISRMPPKKPGDDGYDEAIDSKSDPYSIATEIYQQIKNDDYRLGTNLDHHIICAYLRCIALHCPEGSTERQTRARMVFDEACELGQVSTIVVDAMKKVYGDSLIPELQTKNFPRMWSRHVVDKFR